VQDGTGIASWAPDAALPILACAVDSGPVLSTTSNTLTRAKENLRLLQNNSIESRSRKGSSKLLLAFRVLATDQLPGGPKKIEGMNFE